MKNRELTIQDLKREISTLNSTISHKDIALEGRSKILQGKEESLRKEVGLRMACEKKIGELQNLLKETESKTLGF